MNGEIAVAKDAQAKFEEAMQERLRQAMGDLMPPEVLAKIIADGIERTFFTEKELPYGAPPIKEPALIGKFLAKEVEPIISANVNAWLDVNSDKVEALVKETVEKGIASAVFNTLSRSWMEPMDRLQENLYEAIRRQRGT